MTTNITGLTITSNEIKIDYTQGPILPFAYYYGDTEPKYVPEKYKSKNGSSGDDILTKDDIIYFDNNSPYPILDNAADLEKEWYYPMQYSILGQSVIRQKVSDIYKNNIQDSDDIKDLFNQKLFTNKYKFYSRFGRFDIPNLTGSNVMVSVVKSQKESTPFVKENVMNPEYNNNKYPCTKLLFIDDTLPETTLNNIGSSDNVALLKAYNKDAFDILSKLPDTSGKSLKDYLIVYCPSTDYNGFKFAISTLKTSRSDTILWYKNNVDTEITNMTTSKTSELAYYNNTPPSIFLEDPLLPAFNYTLANESDTLEGAGLITCSDKYSCATTSNIFLSLYSNAKYIDPISLLSYNMNVSNNLFMYYGISNSIIKFSGGLGDSIDPWAYSKISGDSRASNALLAPSNLIKYVNPDTNPDFLNKYILNISSVQDAESLAELYNPLGSTIFNAIINNINTNVKESKDIKLNKLIFYPTPDMPDNILTDLSTGLSIHQPNIYLIQKNKKTGPQLPQLSCDNPYGTINKKTDLSYPNYMYTPYIDIGLYPPVLSNGGGYLFKNGYTLDIKKDNKCTIKAIYNSIGYYGRDITYNNPNSKPNTDSYMKTMFSGDTIPGQRFVTLAFLVSARGDKVTKTDKVTNKLIHYPIDHRPCFGGVNSPPFQQWMYDTMADYYYQEKNSLNNWINAIRQSDGDVILSYGGYNNKMCADALVTKHAIDDTTFIANLANYNDLKILPDKQADPDSPQRKIIDTLKTYYIDDVNSEHDNVSDYRWEYDGTSTPNITQYDKNLYPCYYLPVKYYKVRWIDFDVEAVAQGIIQWKPQILRILALRKLMMENDYINVRYTFPVLPIGLDKAYFILWLTMYAFQDCNVSVRRRLWINLMTMDYGDIENYGFDNAKKKDVFQKDSNKNTIMGYASIFAVCNTALQMQKFSEQIYKGKSNPKDYWLNDGNQATTWSDGYFSRIGNTPMNGLNDSNDGAFTLTGAELVTDFIKSSNGVYASEMDSPSMYLYINNPFWNKAKDTDLYPPQTYTCYKYADSGTPLYDSMKKHFPSTFGPSGHIGMWSFQRDTPCEYKENPKNVSTSCSSGLTTFPFQTKALEYSTIFQKAINTMNDNVSTDDIIDTSNSV